MPRHFLTDSHLSPAEQAEVLDLALTMRSDRFLRRPFEGPRTVAIIFDKPSTRTRVSFATGVSELGGAPLILESSSTQMGRGEPIADTAQVLSRQVSTIVWRTFAQEGLEEMAHHSTVPVVNALSDLYHPCQILADLATLAAHRDSLERSGPALAGRIFVYAGDGANNMAHSYLLGGATAGMHVRIAAPASHQPNPAVVAEAESIASRTGGSVQVMHDMREAAVGAHAIATDTWVSMGQEGEGGRGESVFSDYAITPEIMALGDEAVFLHCLPAYRGKEVSAGVIDGPQSLVWEEAEFRLHAQKALMTWLIDHPDRDTAAHALPTGK